jgi:membrane protease subunit HflK
MTSSRPLFPARRGDDEGDDGPRGPQRRPSETGGGELPELLRGLGDLFRGRSGGSGGGGGGTPAGPRLPTISGVPGFRWGRIAPLAILVVALGYLATGTYVVNPGEVGIVRQFGAVTGGANSEGLHWRIPWPVQRVDIVSVQRIQSMEVGFRSAEGTQVIQLVGDEARMITGDENLVDVQLVVQYRVRDAAAFLFNVKDPLGLPNGQTLRDATESALRQVVGQRSIDDVLTTGKEQVQVETQLLLQRMLDFYGTGIQIENVQLQDVQPPTEGNVQDAFKDVISAREDRDRFINEAQAISADIVPRARGEAARTIASAEAFKAERVAQALGEAARFELRLQEYRLAQEATTVRLYLEMMEDILPDLNVIVVDPFIGSSVLPFLPLDTLPGGS